MSRLVVATVGVMRTLRSIRGVLAQLNPLLIDGTVALVLFALMATQGSKQLQPGQHPMTPLAWVLAVLITAPILTHRRFPRASPYRVVLRLPLQGYACRVTGTRPCPRRASTETALATPKKSCSAPTRISCRTTTTAPGRS